MNAGGLSEPGTAGYIEERNDEHPGSVYAGYGEGERGRLMTRRDCSRRRMGGISSTASGCQKAVGWRSVRPSRWRHFALDIAEQVTPYMTLESEDPLYQTLLAQLLNNPDD
jgi:hypothetical protein